MIAHRLSTLKNCDYIYKLDKHGSVRRRSKDESKYFSGRRRWLYRHRLSQIISKKVLMLFVLIIS